MAEQLFIPKKVRARVASTVMLERALQRGGLSNTKQVIDELLRITQEQELDKWLAIERWTQRNPPGGDAAYVVVADDGTGDFDSIKEAIEASDNGVNNEAGTFIWVKPGTYDDGGQGQVNLNGPKRVYVFAPPPPMNALATAYQRWTFDGFSCTTGTANVTLCGFGPQTGATEDWLQGAGTIYLHLDRCKGLSGRGFFGATGTHHLRLTDTDASALVLFTASTGATVPVTVYSDNSDVSITQGASTPPTLTGVNSFRLVGGDISHAAALTFSNSAGSGGTLIMADGHISGGGTLTSLFDTVIIHGLVTDEDSTGIATLSIDGISGSRFCTFDLAANNLYDCTLQTGSLCRGSVHGAYQNLVCASIDCSYFIELDTITAITAIAINNTVSGGDGNFIVASIRTPGGGSSKAVAIASGANNNVVLYSSTTSFAVADTDSGTGNRINSFPPSGAAGGDLTGSYPNPTLAAIIAAGGPTGSATVVPIITWDAKGRLTAVSSATISGVVPRKFSQNLGDTVSTSFNVDHNFNTLDVQTEVWDNSTGEVVFPTVVHSTVNRVVVTFTVAPGTDAYRITVIG